MYRGCSQSRVHRTILNIRKTRWGGVDTRNFGILADRVRAAGYDAYDKRTNSTVRNKGGMKVLQGNPKSEDYAFGAKRKHAAIVDKMRKALPAKVSKDVMDDYWGVIDRAEDRDAYKTTKSKTSDRTRRIENYRNAKRYYQSVGGGKDAWNWVAQSKRDLPESWTD